MTERQKLKVHVVFGEAYMDVEGTPDEVFQSLARFLTKLYPSLEVAQRLRHSPDLSQLANDLSGVVELAEDGPMIAAGKTLAARDALILALTGAYVGQRLGVLEKESLTGRQLKIATGKAGKTVMNQLPRLVESGLVERLAQGEYRVTHTGVREGQAAAAAARET